MFSEFFKVPESDLLSCSLCRVSSPGLQALRNRGLKKKGSPS